MFQNTVWDIEDYLEKIEYSRKNISLDEFEELNTGFWTYPLNEVEYILENKISVVLVKFSEIYGGYEYRWCELPV